MWFWGHDSAFILRSTLRFIYQILNHHHFIAIIDIIFQKRDLGLFQDGIPFLIQEGYRDLYEELELASPCLLNSCTSTIKASLSARDV